MEVAVVDLKVGNLRNDHNDYRKYSRTALKNTSSRYSYHYATISCRFAFKMCSNCRGINRYKRVRSVETQLKINGHTLSSSTEPENWSFDVVI